MALFRCKNFPTLETKTWCLTASHPNACMWMRSLIKECALCFVCPISFCRISISTRLFSFFYCSLFPVCYSFCSSVNSVASTWHDKCLCTIIRMLCSESKASENENESVGVGKKHKHFLNITIFHCIPYEPHLMYPWITNRHTDCRIDDSRQSLRSLCLFASLLRYFNLMLFISM